MGVWEFIKQLTNPESIINYGGLLLLLIVIFAETGLFVGFFLPGDSLVFIAGLFCATNNSLLDVSLPTLMFSLVLAAFLGNIFGYWFGKRVGEKLYRKEDSLLFKKRHVEVTQKFYSKHGGKTLILGRFLPVIRTFAPILAGVIKIDFKIFLLYNFIGALAWIVSLTSIGYFLGVSFPQVKDYIGWIVIILIIITAIPVLLTAISGKNSKR